MECTETALLAEKYEFGELQGYKKRSFEHHVKNCKKCHAKYGAILLLGALMGSSAKSAEYSAGSSTLSMVLKSKTVTVATVLMITAVTGTAAFNKIRHNSEIKNRTSEESVILKKEQNIDNIVEKENEKQLKTLRIISKYEEKEVEITVDKSNLKMQNRLEK